MEQTISVSMARQNLMKLTRQISERMGKVVLTNKGKAETVLMSFAEYQSLMAAAELALHPEVLMAGNRGIQEIEGGWGVGLERAMQQEREGDPVDRGREYYDKGRSQWAQYVEKGRAIVEAAEKPQSQWTEYVEKGRSLEQEETTETPVQADQRYYSSLKSRAE